MIRDTARTKETNTNVTASENEHSSRAPTACRIEAWFRILITLMTFLLGLIVIMDSELLIGLA